MHFWEQTWMDITYFLQNRDLQLVICHQSSGSANVRALNSKYALQCSGYLWDNLIQCHIRLSQQLKHSILVARRLYFKRKKDAKQPTLWWLQLWRWRRWRWRQWRWRWQWWNLFSPRLPDMMIFDTRLIIVIINYDDDEDFENDYINQDYNIKIIWKWSNMKIIWKWLYHQGLSGSLQNHEA